MESIGYGIDGTLTRREWQKQCAGMLGTDAQTFNLWQKKLRTVQAQYARNDVPKFDWEVSFDGKTNQVMGWSDTPDYFVFDVTNYTFDENIFIEGYNFLTGVNFNGATFNGYFSLINSRFERVVYFQGATFKQHATIQNLEIIRAINFEYSVFNFYCSFAYNKFESNAIFKFVQFKGEARFHGVLFNFVSFDGAEFAKDVDFSGNSPLNENKLQTFGRSSFSGVQFKGHADFSNREFKGATSFDVLGEVPTIFTKPPLFHNCILHQDTTFSDVIFTQSESIDKYAARAFNTLRHAMSKQQSTREEQRFLKLELDSERVLAKGGMRYLYWIYKQVADYGFSVGRPIIILVIVPAIILLPVYAILAGYNQCNSILNYTCHFNFENFFSVLEFSFLHSLPPIGLDRLVESSKNTLFQNTNAHNGLVLPIMIVTQKFLSIAGWFFIFLALRNTFKMK